MSDANVRDGASEEPPLRARQHRPRLQVPHERGVPKQVRNRTRAPVAVTKEDRRVLRESQINFVIQFISLNEFDLSFHL